MAPSPLWRVDERILRPEPEGEIPNYATPVNPERQSFVGAWFASLLGFIAVALSSVMYLVYYEWFISAAERGGWGYDDYEDIGRLGSVAGYAEFGGVVLLIIGALFVMRGMMVAEQASRYRKAIMGALKKLQWLAACAVILYLVALIFKVLVGEGWIDTGGYTVFRLMYYPSIFGIVVLAALPTFVVHQLFMGGR